MEKQTKFKPKRHRVPMRGFDKFVIFFFSIVAILLIVSMFTKNEEPPNNISQKKEDLKAKVFIRDGALHVINQNSYSWSPMHTFSGKGVIFKLNDTFKFIYYGSISPGQEVIVALTKFTKKDGLFFNPFQYRAKDLFVQCDEGFESYSFF